MAISETLIMTAANAVPRGVQRLIRGAVTSDRLMRWIDAVTQRTLRRVRKTNRIAIVADTNIGDAVVLHGACAAFKRWLPGCEIDYFYQRKAHPLLRVSPFVDGHQPVFTDADFTSAKNREAIQAAIREREYDLILNLYPFLMNSELAGAGCPVLVPYRLIADIVRAETNPTTQAHVAFHLHRFVESIAQRLAGRPDTASAEADYIENVIYLSGEVPACAAEILRAAGVEADARIAFLNPDSSSRFSCIPLPMQEELLRNLLDMDRYRHVLLGPAYSFPEVPDELCARLAGHSGFRRLVRLPKDIPIDTYAGIIDRADLFITADTAQMHIAASRRKMLGPGGGFRNHTALVSIFGATNSRVYGYDSFSEGYLDSGQDAPARVFEGRPPCKNLTCIHKTRKNCRTVECFTGLSADTILEWIKECNRPTELATRDSDSAGEIPVQLFATPRWSQTGFVAPEQHKPIIVVSGLPRSGTSLMMQMLQAGGIQIATDGVRSADADNPRGYYEFEPVKRLDWDASWLGECRQKAVKIISMLLPALPAHHAYSIIFMERSLPEILASQRMMLERRGTPDPDDSDEALTVSYQRHLALVKQALACRPEIQTLYVSYHEILESPRRIANQVSRFLQQDLDIDGMLRAVDAGLHRQKQGIS
jgi:ADP-heptose:LPS heptosyltransferase